LSSTAHERFADLARDAFAPDRIEALCTAWPAFEAAGGKAWPGFAPRPETLAAAVIDKLRGATDPIDALSRLDPPEVWLAAACADAIPAALRAFEDRFVQPLDGPLSAAVRDAARADEIRQRLRQRLLTRTEQGTVRLVEYAGEGKLRALVKVTAMRIATDLAREEKRSPHKFAAAEVDTAEALMDDDVGPEVRAVLGQHREAIKRAFEAAVTELDPTDKGMLRLHLLEGISIDGIAALHGVHRSTAARRILRVRGQVGDRVRALLRERLALSDPGLESLFRAVDSQLDLSLTRVLDGGGREGARDDGGAG
jgi:RNA polymerase sigma-70 factor (ECF subfamily)